MSVFVTFYPDPSFAGSLAPRALERALHTLKKHGAHPILHPDVAANFEFPSGSGSFYATGFVDIELAVQPSGADLQILETVLTVADTIAHRFAGFQAFIEVDRSRGRKFTSILSELTKFSRQHGFRVGISNPKQDLLLLSANGKGRSVRDVEDDNERN